MCIAIIKRQDNKLPTKKILKECWKRNEDGGGYAVWNEERQVWSVRKGFKKFTPFYKALRTIPKDGLAFIHFRLATSGKEGHPGCTHPFPVTDNEDMLMELEFDSADIIMHNGVIGQGEDLLSDTQVAIRDIIDLMHPLLEDDRATRILGDSLRPFSNRWVVTRGRTMYRWGDWKEDPKTQCLISKDLPTIYKKRAVTSNPTMQGGWWNRNEQQAYGVAPSNVTNATTSTSAITPSKTLAGLPTLSLSESIFSVEMGDFVSVYLDEKGNWDWNIWTGADEGQIDDSSNCTEIFDENGRAIGLVDNDTGETIWENDDEDVSTTETAAYSEGGDTICPHCDAQFILFPSDHGHCPWCRQKLEDPVVAKFKQVDALTNRDCPECGNPVTLASLTHKGECPWCKTEFDFGLDEDEDDLCCPSCGEQHYLDESPWECGDTLCKKCGAVFADDTREIMVWDLNIAREFNERQEMLYESH